MLGPQAALTRVLVVVLLVWALVGLNSGMGPQPGPTPGRFRANQIFASSSFQHGYLRYRHLRESAIHLRAMRHGDETAAGEAAAAGQTSPHLGASSAAADAEQRPADDAASTSNATDDGSSLYYEAGPVRKAAGRALAAVAPSARCGCPLGGGTPWCNFLTGETLINLCTARCLNLTSITPGRCEQLLSSDGGLATAEASPLAPTSSPPAGSGDADGGGFSAAEAAPAGQTAAGAAGSPAKPAAALPSSSNSSSSASKPAASTAPAASGSAAKPTAAAGCSCPTLYAPVCASNGKVRCCHLVARAASALPTNAGPAALVQSPADMLMPEPRASADLCQPVPRQVRQGGHPQVGAAQEAG